MDAKTIKQYIRAGIIKGYKEHLQLISSYSEFVDAIREYLLTVNVAQALLEWDKPYSYKIRIEYPVLNFFNNAFPSVKIEYTDIFNMELISRELGHAPTKSYHQKLDIAIVEEQSRGFANNERSLVGIELKAINVSEAIFIKDIHRLVKAMSITDRIDSNSIKFRFGAFLKRLDQNTELITAATIKERNDKQHIHWTEICNNLNATYPFLNFDTELFEIANTPYENVASRFESSDDYSEVANETGSISGCIISIARK